LDNIDILINGYKNLRIMTKAMNNRKIDTNKINEVYELCNKLKITDERLDFRYEEDKFYALYKNILLEVTEELGMVYTYFFSILDKEYKLKDLEDSEIIEMLDGKRTILADLSNISIDNLMKTLKNRVKTGKNICDEFTLMNRALNEYQTVWDICTKGKELNFEHIKIYFREMSEELSDTKIRVIYGSTGIDIINKRSAGKAAIEAYISIYEDKKEIYKDLYLRDIIDIVDLLDEKRKRNFNLKYS